MNLPEIFTPTTPKQRELAEQLLRLGASLGMSDPLSIDSAVAILTYAQNNRQRAEVRYGQNVVGAVESYRNRMHNLVTSDVMYSSDVPVQTLPVTEAKQIEKPDPIPTSLPEVSTIKKLKPAADWTHAEKLQLLDEVQRRIDQSLESSEGDVRPVCKARGAAPHLYYLWKRNRKHLEALAIREKELVKCKPIFQTAPSCWNIDEIGIFMEYYEKTLDIQGLARRTLKEFGVTLNLLKEFKAKLAMKKKKSAVAAASPEASQPELTPEQAMRKFGQVLFGLFAKAATTPDSSIPKGVGADQLGTFAVEVMGSILKPMSEQLLNVNKEVSVVPEAQHSSAEADGVKPETLK